MLVMDWAMDWAMDSGRVENTTQSAEIGGGRD
jgi:hypothetical protein